MGHMETPLELLSCHNIHDLLSDVVFQSMKDPVIFIDHDYRILWANRAGTRTGAIGRSCYEVFQERREPCTKCAVDAMFGSGKADVVEKWIPFPGGSGRWFEVRTYPISDRSGRIVCALKISFDITNRKHVLEKQKKYIESLEKTVKQMEWDIPRARLLSKDMADPCPRFSRREMEVLRLISEGLTNPEISHMLSVSPNTVKTHVTHIFNKLGVSDRTQAAVQAVRLRLI